MAERKQMSQDNEELTSQELADIRERGRVAMEALDKEYNKPPTRPERPLQIHNTTEEVTPVKLDLSFTPEETKEAIAQTEASNILADLISGKIRVTPKTAIWVALATTASIVATKLSGCW